MKTDMILPCCLILLCLSAAGAGADGFGFTFSTDTFIPFCQADTSPVLPGLHTRTGVSWLPGDHLEIEIFHIPQLTPRFYSQIFYGFSVGWWLFQRKTTSCFNVTIDAGVLFSSDLSGFSHTKLLCLQLSPIVLGGPHYSFSDRLLTVGILFDPDRQCLVFEMQFLSITLFL